MMRDIRGSTQLLATPVAGAFAAVPGGVTPGQAMKASLGMAKDVLVNPKVSVDEGVNTAAQDWLKNRGVGQYGGKKPDVADVAALSMLGFFNLFGDPAFEFGAGLKGADALKEFATYKKVGEVTQPLAEGTSFIKGTTREMTIPISEDLKIKVVPKEDSIVIQGYKKRFPSQAALPDTELSKETQNLIASSREATGHEMQARFEGNDLVLKPQLDKPIPNVGAVSNKTSSPLLETLPPKEGYYVTHTVSGPEYTKLRPGTFTVPVKGLPDRPSDISAADWRTIHQDVVPLAPSSEEKTFWKQEFQKVVNSLPEKEKNDAIHQYATFLANGATPEEQVVALKKAVIGFRDRGGNLQQHFNAIFSEQSPPSTEPSPDNAPSAVSQISSSPVRQPSVADAVLGNQNAPQTAVPPSTPPIPRPIEPIPSSGPIKTSKLAQGVEAKAIEKGLTDRFSGLPEYNQMNLKEQAQFAADLLQSDPQKAINIATGKELPPNHITPEAVFTAVENQALKNNDIETLRELASGSLTHEATAMGQRIRVLRERNPYSPVAAIQQVMKERELAKVGKLKGKTVKQAKKEVAGEIKQTVKNSRPKFKDWQEFIHSIEC